MNSVTLIISDQQDILKEIFYHFKKQYSCQDIEQLENLDDFIINVEIPQLEEHEVKLCEGLFTMEECYNVVQNMNGEASPGIDGLGAAFYKTFWVKIKHLVLNSLNYAFSNQCLSCSQKRNVVVLIPKSSVNSRQRIHNFRPISLTCTDYKIGASILAKRLQKVITKLVHTDQTGYIKGRGIFQNIRLIEDIIWYTDKEKIEAVLLSLDYSKAFDCISKSYIQNILAKFGFGPDFQNCFSVFNKDSKSCVLNCGWMTNWFPLGRGLRQGCPLSGLLFVLGIEILSCKIRQCNNIIGIQLPLEARQVKITQYADDSTFMLSDEQSVENVIKIVTNFSQISGLKLNENKSQALWLGPWKTRRDKPFGLQWNTYPNCCIKILGVVFHSNKSASECIENWVKRIENIENIVKSWNKRKITVIGRVTIVKSLMISQIVHLLMVVTVPEWVKTEINTLIFKFLWGGYKEGIEKVKRKILIQDFSEGGIKMIDINSFQKKLVMSWVDRLQQVYQIDQKCRPNWSVIPMWILEKFGPEQIIFKLNATLKCLPTIYDIIKPCPSFWTLLIKLIYDRPEVKDVTNNDIIWCNDKIIINQIVCTLKNGLKRIL